MAESGGNPSARNVNSDSHHSVDRGLWQVNNYWHPEVSDSCAFSSGCNAKAALKISSGGSNWSPWATYNGGAYKSHLSAARSACGELAPQEAGFAKDVVERPPVIVVPPRTAELAQCLPNGEYCSNADPCCGSCSWGTCGDSTDEKEAQDDAWDAAHRFGPGGKKRYGPGGGIQRLFGPGATEPVKPDVPPHVNEAQVGGEPASCTHKLKELCGHCGGDKGCWLSCAKSHKGQLLAAGCHPPQSEEKEVATEAQVGGEPASCTHKLKELCGHCGGDKGCWLSCAKSHKGQLLAAGCHPPQSEDEDKTVFERPPVIVVPPHAEGTPVHTKEDIFLFNEYGEHCAVLGIPGGKTSAFWKEFGYKYDHFKKGRCPHYYNFVNKRISDVEGVANVDMMVRGMNKPKRSFRDVVAVLGSANACPSDPCSCCPHDGKGAGACPCLCGGGWCKRCCQ
jgi:hypothetical protein